MFLNNFLHFHISCYTQTPTKILRMNNFIMEEIIHVIFKPSQMHYFILGLYLKWPNDDLVTIWQNSVLLDTVYNISTWHNLNKIFSYYTAAAAIQKCSSLDLWLYLQVSLDFWERI